jgi:hypothetical protein
VRPEALTEPDIFIREMQFPDDGWLQYIPHRRVFEKMAEGWVIADHYAHDPIHARYTVIMWHCDCEEHPVKFNGMNR